MDSSEFLLAAGERDVGLWSSRRLPFEPTGWLKQMRDELRVALLGMSPEAHRLLHASFVSTDRRYEVDAENVVTYNVGGRYLRHLLTSGIVIERGFGQPPAPHPGYEHYQGYRLIDPTEGFVHWTTGPPIASLHGVSVDRVKCADIWAAIRRASGTPERVRPAAVPFTLTATVRLPVGTHATSRSLPDLIKPLIDGVVSAFHTHDVPNAEVIAARLDAEGVGVRHELAAQLADPAWAALGPRHLVHAHGGAGVAWNPADHLCMATRIEFTAGTTGHWEIDAHLHEAHPLDPTLDPRATPPATGTAVGPERQHGGAWPDTPPGPPTKTGGPAMPGQSTDDRTGTYAGGRAYPLPALWEPAPAEVLEHALARTHEALDPAGDVRERLRAYYDPEGHYAGALMTTLDPNPENEICPADLFAVSMLSIRVPQLAARRLLEPGERRRTIHRRLRDIPYGLPITSLDATHPDVARATNAMWDLYNEIRTVLADDDHDSNWWVLAAKLCARKRPYLFPVRDTLVCGYLSPDGKLGNRHGVGRFDIDLQIFAYLMTDPEVAKRLAGLRAHLEQHERLRVDDTDLRLLDAALWTAARL